MSTSEENGNKSKKASQPSQSQVVQQQQLQQQQHQQVQLLKQRQLYRYLILQQLFNLAIAHLLVFLVHFRMLLHYDRHLVQYMRQWPVFLMVSMDKYFMVVSSNLEI